MLSLGLHLGTCAGRAVRGGGSPILFEYHVGDDIAALGGTFTRAGAAVYADYNGQLNSAGEHVPRDNHWINGKQYLLLEGQCSAYLAQSFFMWSTDTPVYVSNSESSFLPLFADGPQTQYISHGGDTSSESRQAIYTAFYTQSAGVHTFSVWLRGPVGKGVYLYVHDQRKRVDFLGVDRWQRETLTLTLPAAEILVFFDITDYSGTDHFPTGGYEAALPSLEPGPFASSTIVGENAYYTRAADSLWFPYTRQESLYFRFIEFGTAQVQGLYLFSIGGAAQFWVKSKNGGYSVGVH